MVRRGLSRVRAVAANTFRETVRERVLYNLVLFALLMTVSGLLLNELSIRQDEKIIKDVGLAAMELFGTLIAVFVGVGLVSKEIERRSLYPLLARPLSRDELLLGKFAGLGFTLLVNVSVMALGLYLTLWLAGWPFDPSLLEAILALYVGLLVVVALALLFSTLTSSVVAAVCTFSLALAGRYADILRDAQAYAPNMPRWLTATLHLALPNFQHFDLKDRVVHKAPVPAADLLWIVLYGAVYASVVLILARLSFRRREL